MHIFQTENLQRFLYCVHIQLLSVRWFVHSFLCKLLLLLYSILLFFSLSLFLFFIIHHFSSLDFRFRYDRLLLMRYFFDVQFVKYIRFLFIIVFFHFHSVLVKKRCSVYQSLVAFKMRCFCSISASQSSIFSSLYFCVCYYRHHCIPRATCMFNVQHQAFNITS